MSHISEPFRCYVGEGDNIQEEICSECINVGCLCGKIPQFNNGQTRRICRVNPHNALKEGCGQNDYYQGLMVNLCYCKEPLCNAGHHIRPESFATLVLPLLVLYKILH